MALLDLAHPVEVIKGSVSRALQLYNFIALGAVVHFLHNRRAVDDLAPWWKQYSQALKYL